MSLFANNIDNSPITALQIASLTSNECFGRYSGWNYLKSSISLDNITKKDIDVVLSNVLSYIYYLVLLGINNTNINQTQISIPTGLFGVYQYNFVKYQWIIEYVIEYLQKLGFRATYCFNDDKLVIDWIEKYCEVHNIQ